MPKIDLNEADLKQLFDAINNTAEPPHELIPRLFPSFAEKLRQDGKPAWGGRCTSTPSMHQ
jgi:hypothetical protein